MSTKSSPGLPADQLKDTERLYDEAAGPKNLSMSKKVIDSAVDGVAMGVGVLLVSTGIRKVDKKLSPDASKVSGAKIVGGCALASVLIQVIKSDNIIPSTYGHVMYRYKEMFG